MNVAFHELVGIAIAHEAGARLSAADPPRRALVWTSAAALALLSHGVLDNLPHYYPLTPLADTVTSLSLVAAALAVVPRGMRVPLFLICVAALLPDIIDHVPDDLRRNFHLEVPVPPNFFPWHWPSNAASLRGRTGPLWIESWTNHLTVLAFAATGIARNHRLWRAPYGTTSQM